MLIGRVTTATRAKTKLILKKYIYIPRSKVKPYANTYRSVGQYLPASVMLLLLSSQLYCILGDFCQHGVHCIL